MMDDLLRMMRLQFKLALEGKRPVFCSRCNRPYKARLDKAGVVPYRHACKGGRAVCDGSHLPARLS